MSGHYWRSILAAGLACFAVGGFADQYVAQNGQSPVSPYASWDTAASNIQQAVGAAAAGGTVWVTNGPYLAMAGSNHVVYINKALKLRGCRTWPDTVTLDGGGAARGIYVGLAAAAEVVIDGFTITNCTVGDHGAGIYLNHSLISAGTGMVLNCVLRDNTATGANLGGGLRSYGQSSSSAFQTWVSNCVIAGNAAASGGGAHFQATRVLAFDSRFEGNYATNTGGGLYTVSVNTSLFVRCSIVSNTCDNSVSDLGGGGAYISTSLENAFERCAFEANEARYQHGGALWVRGSVSMTGCVVRANRALASGEGWGGGIYVYPTVPSITLYNSLLVGNAGQMAGAIYGGNNPTTTYVIVNCTIASNTCWQGSGGGLGVAGTNANIEICNSILEWNSRTNNFTHAAANYTFSDGLGVKRIRNSAVLPFPTAYDGGGNTTNDARFVSLANGNYHLAAGSPCINTGTNQAWMMGAIDLDGKNRIDPGTGLVDMGCFEYVYPGGTLVVVR